MINILIEQNCYVCGRMTTHESSLCGKCRINSQLIEGKVCTVCGIPLISEKSFCQKCRTKTFSFDRNDSLFLYSGIAREVFYQYKFKKHRKIGLWYCSLLAEKILKEYKDHIIVPSPYRYFKKISKGWDQVEYLVQILSRKYSIDFYYLLKRKSGKDQKKLDLINRQNNLRGNILFRMAKKDIKGKKILFIDDIFTTGATSEECSRILKEHGAAVVNVLTIAID